MDTNTKYKPLRLFTETMINMYRRGYYAKEIRANKMTYGTMERISVEVTNFRSSDPFVQCSPGLFDGITKVQPLLMIGQIMAELKMNNPLWKCPRPRKSETRKATEILVKKGILIAIKSTDYFLVCPDKIWRGNQLVVCTSFLKLMENRKPSSISDSDIKDLKAVSSYAVVGLFDEWDNPKIRKPKKSPGSKDQTSTENLDE